VPAADKAGVRLACHPHDPAYPVGGPQRRRARCRLGRGIRKFLRLSDSKNHGLNFCQGTVAEMFKGPGLAMIPVIEEFASTGRIFMVHFRNIRGGYLDFQEVFPDEGDVDMFEATRAASCRPRAWRRRPVPDSIPPGGNPHDPSFFSLLCSGPAGHGGACHREVDRWTRVITTAGIQPE